MVLLAIDGSYAWEGFGDDVVTNVVTIDADNPRKDDLDIRIRAESFETKLKISSSPCACALLSTSVLSREGFQSSP